MKLSITPKKSLGQNFLINPRILDKIVAAAEITKEDVVLEVGPGTGNLTEKLAEKAGRVIAVEKDEKLVELLRNKFAALFAIANIPTFVQNDILKFNVSDFKLKASEYKIVANIPYYITSRFLRKIFTEWPKPQLIVLTIQKEVAQRIIAKPPHMNLLAVSVQLFATADILCYVTKSQFRPIPKVDSAIIKLTPREELSTDNPEKFFKIAKAGFSGKRKQLINSISSNLKKQKEEIEKILKEVGINSKSRPEELDIDDWMRLKKLLD